MNYPIFLYMNLLHQLIIMLHLQHPFPVKHLFLILMLGQMMMTFAYRWERAAIVYIQVTYEESMRRNEARYQEKLAH